MLLSKCVVCGTKKSRFVKKPETSGLLSSLGIQTGSDKIPIFCPICFQRYKFNEKVKMLLLAEDKFKAEMHLRKSLDLPKCQ